ncbi:hypothetical protein PVAND_009699 [Polypedilum vanderplanki]|uniref:Zinc finger protein n=1 Tax=Polypedilum vanderplanki TaxID=319348 RepID=A0A9J6CEX6_POLVA|nr:hypothetical protein PVAND_009699 [Polypedilum vanderplanki]
MSSQFKMCRLCMVYKGSDELESIFKAETARIALEIYLISGIKIMEFASHKISALICSTCVKDLTRAIKFRKLCLESDEFFKKLLQAVESTVWSEKYKNIFSHSEYPNDEEKLIKVEPFEYDFETIFDENAEILDYAGKQKELEEKSDDYFDNDEQPAKRSSDSDDSDLNVKRNEHGEFQCKLCHKNFTRHYSLKCHIYAVHKKINKTEMHKCEECGKLFKLKYYLQKHLKRSHPQFKTKLGLMDDKKDDEDEVFKSKITGINCPFCNKYLTSRHSLKDHIRVKHEFTNANEKHMKATHFKIKENDKKENNYPCSICGKLLKSKGNLSTHEKTHRVLSPSEYYYCDLCGNKFKGKGEMTFHIKKRHLYKIRYPCEKCGKSWRTGHQLRKHIKIFHDNIREFKCEWCGKDFGDKNILAAHVRIHTGEQPFQCKYCDRKFTHQTDMRRHQWGHTGRRPYQCSSSSCGRGFMKKAELVSHESRCHHHINAPVILKPEQNHAKSLQYQYEMLSLVKFYHKIMSSQFKMCRLCMVYKGSDELESIFKAETARIALEIYLISGVKIMEFASHKISALICSTCVKDLTRAIKFRKLCLESDEFFKKSLQAVETTVWSEKYKNIFSHSEFPNDEEKLIKVEPVEYGFATIFDENAEMLDYAGKQEEEEEQESDNYFDNDKQPATSSEKKPVQKRRRRRRRSSDSDDSDLNVKRNEHGEFQCKLCHKNFTRHYSLKCHIYAVHKKINKTEMHKCEECGKLFKLKYYLQKHLKRSHLQLKKKLGLIDDNKDDEDEVFKSKITGINCPFCNKYLTSRHSLKDHIRVKHEFTNANERYLCDFCGKDFQLKYYLLRHMKATHFKIKEPKNETIKKEKDKKENNYPCSICGKLLKSKGNLSTHEKTHRVLSPSEYYYCDLCGNKFKGRGEMTVHIKKRHLYKIRYPCEKCGKSWRTGHQLRKHIKIFHDNIREFKCEWCGKDFGEKNKLVAHVRIHTGEQPFQCKYCDRKFTHQTDMRRHQWGHTGRRPYQCSSSSCGRGFMKKSELVSHESRCHHHINAPVILKPEQNHAKSLQYQYEML